MKYVYMIRVDSGDGTEISLFSSRKKALREFKNEVSWARDTGKKVESSEDYGNYYATWETVAIEMKKVVVN